MEQLDHVRQTFRGDDVDAMEDSLLALWRVGYDPVIADLLMELEANLDSRRPLPREQGWWQVPHRRTAAKLERARKGGSGDAIARRLRDLWESQGTDPRLSRFAVDLLRNSPSSRNLALDTVLWEIIEHTRDPAVVDGMATVPERSLWIRDYSEDGQPLVKCTLAPRFNKRLASFPERSSSWRCTRLPSPVHVELLALVREKMAALAAPHIPVGDALLPLFESILENPGDDAPRHVFADRCIEEGDRERGEFITLQLMEAERRTPAGLKRMNAILKKRQTEWMGDAAKVTAKRSWVFERGFPHAATIARASEEALKLSRGAIGWRTMRELTVQTRNENWLLLLEKPSLGALTTLRGDMRRWLPLVAAQFGHRLLELDMVVHPAPSSSSHDHDLRFAALKRLRITPSHRRFAETVQTRRPLGVLHLTNPAIGSPLLARRFAISPQQALEWLERQRPRVSGRTELEFVQGNEPLLKIHSKLSGDRWVHAVAAGEDLGGLEGVLEALEPDVRVRRSL